MTEEKAADIEAAVGTIARQPNLRDYRAIILRRRYWTTRNRAMRLLEMALLRGFVHG